MAFPYVHAEIGARPQMPGLFLHNGSAQWDLEQARGEFQGVDLTSTPFWKISQEVAPGVEKFALRPIEDMGNPDGPVYPQLAVLNWLGSDNYHYSRLIPWEIIPADLPGADRGFRITHWFLLVALVALAAFAGWYLRQNGWTQRVQKLFEYAFILALSLWLVSFQQAQLWFQPTWITGGDLASHTLYAQQFYEWVTAGKITGWMPEVYAGFPAFRFYFPLPFLMISLLAALFPLQVAMKLAVVAPAILLPTAVYWLGGRFNWPGVSRLFAALFSVAFLAHDGSTVWGGNLRALYAGEFAFSWGLLMLLLFWGSLAWALRHGGQRWVVPSLLLASTGLSHGYPLLIAGFSALFAPLFFQSRPVILVNVLRIHLAAFLLLGFWLIPLFENLPYTIPNDTAAWSRQLEALLPHSMRPPLLALLAIPLLIGRVRKAAGVLFLLLVTLLAVTAYSAAHAVGLADIRFFPFAQLSLLLACGGALGLALERFGREAGNWCVTIATLLLVHVWLVDMQNLEQRAAWSFAGYENKAMWPHYRDLANHLRGPESAPRVLFEHAPENTDIGSTRAMEALPLFGSRPVLEGLYMETAFSGPFIYQLQAEVSQQPSSPLARFPAVRGTSHDLAERLLGFYADTVVVRSEMSAKMLEEHPQFAFEAAFGPLKVFRLQQSPTLIGIPDALQSVPNRHDWLENAFENYLLPGNTALTTWQGKHHRVPAEQGGSTTIRILEFDDEYLKFSTARPGIPHIVRITYHPGWRSLGGEAVHLVAPAFMLIVPESETVELVFAKTHGQTLGLYLSLAGLILLGLPFMRPLPAQRSDSARYVLAVAALLILTAACAIIWHPQRNYERGQELFRNGAYVNASIEFEKATNLRRAKAHRAEARFWTARTADLAGDHSRAKKHYQALLQETPAGYWAPETLYRLARIAENGGDKASSAELYAQLREQFPRNRWTRIAQEKQTNSR